MRYNALRNEKYRCSSRFWLNSSESYKMGVGVGDSAGGQVHGSVNLTFSVVSSTIVNKLGCRVVDRLGDKC